ncbi:hypothetical protein ACNJUT_21760, partial [Mycobacterium tuberculosis]
NPASPAAQAPAPVVAAASPTPAATAPVVRRPASKPAGAPLAKKPAPKLAPGQYKRVHTPTRPPVIDQRLPQYDPNNPRGA